MCVYLHYNRTFLCNLHNNIFIEWIQLCVYIYTITGLYPSLYISSLNGYSYVCIFTQKRTLSTFIYTSYSSVVIKNQFICLLYISLISMYRSRSVNAVRIYEFVVVQYIYQSPKFKTDHRNETQYGKPGFLNGGPAVLQIPTFLLRNFVSCGFFTFSFQISGF